MYKRQEYNWYVNNYDGKVVQAPTDKETFYPDLESFEKLITDKTRVVPVSYTHLDVYKRQREGRYHT